MWWEVNDNGNSSKHGSLTNVNGILWADAWSKDCDGLENIDQCKTFISWYEI